LNRKSTNPKTPASEENSGCTDGTIINRSVHLAERESTLIPCVLITANVSACLDDNRFAVYAARMLTGARAVIVAAAIVTIGMVAREYLPRYDIRHVGGSSYVRIDRWTGHAEYTTLRTPSAWLQVEPEALALHAVTVPWTLPALPTWADVSPLAALAVLWLAVWKGPGALAWLHRRRRPRRAA
jgi:hypothetical protein